MKDPNRPFKFNNIEIFTFAFQYKNKFNGTQKVEAFK